MNNTDEPFELRTLNITATWVTEAEIYAIALMLMLYIDKSGLGKQLVEVY